MVHVVLYVPNLIGYARILFLYVSYAVAAGERGHWQLATACYLLSFAGDLFDGWAARKFDQASQFGYVLDMVTDRCATTGLLSILCGLYPKWTPTLLFAQMLDLGSHWYHMYASLLLGLGSHKECTNPLLKFYYKKAPLFLACAGTELWYMSLYVLAWTDVQAVRLLFLLCSPICAFKQVANVVQMAVACEALVAHDEKTKKKPAAAAAPSASTSARSASPAPRSAKKKS